MIVLQILVKCDKRLIPLFKRSFPADIIYFSKSHPVPEDKYDFHIPVGSLPLTFRKSPECFRKYQKIMDSSWKNIIIVNMDLTKFESFRNLYVRGTSFFRLFSFVFDFLVIFEYIFWNCFYEDENWKCYIFHY